MVNVLKFLLIFGITGSFYLSYLGYAPCEYCLIIRYSLILSLIFSLFKKTYFLTPLFIFIGILADIPIIKNDFFSKGLCINGSLCLSPEFLKVKASVWAILILIPAFTISIISMKKRKKEHTETTTL